MEKNEYKPPIGDWIIVCFFSCLFTYLVMSCTSKHESEEYETEIEELRNRVNELEGRTEDLEVKASDNESDIDVVEGDVCDHEDRISYLEMEVL